MYRPSGELNPCVGQAAPPFLNALFLCCLIHFLPSLLKLRHPNLKSGARFHFIHVFLCLDWKVRGPASRLKKTLAGLSILPHFVVWLLTLSPCVSASLLAIDPIMLLCAMALDTLKRLACVPASL